MERKDIVRGVLDAAEQFIGRRLWKTVHEFRLLRGTSGRPG